MSHSPLRDLTEAVHGFAPAPSHADDCPDCAGRLGRLEAELDLLRRAEARVAPPAASSRGWRRVPVAAAAALLLGVLAYVVVPRPEAPGVAGQERPDLVSRFLDGTPAESERARAALLETGALAEVVEARRKRPDAARSDALSALTFELKRREAGERGQAAFATLDRARITLDMENAPLTAVVDYLRELLLLDILAHPQDDIPVTSLKLADTPARQSLDLLVRGAGQEYAFRWGRIYFAPAEKLWGPKALPREGRWRSQEPGEASRATLRQLETMKIDLAFENTDFVDIVSFLRDFSKLNIVLEKGVEAPPLTLKVKGAALGEVLELVTLPHGNDARLDEGAIVLYRGK
ncbi:MAG TPA: hypothetical protein VF950_05625 [Planctomycetota bacterium]